MEINSRKFTRSKLLRRSRVIGISRRVWIPRLVFWTGAATIGLVSVAFAVLADEAQRIFHLAITPAAGTDQIWREFIPVIVTPMGFVACAWVAARFFPGSQGSGIPQAIASRHLREDDDRAHLLSLRLAVGKVCLTVMGLLSGASIGREGPTVQVGASIMLTAARWGGMARARGLILAGSAAGIAAAFNTPLAGIVFAIEEMGRTYEARTNGLILSAVILAGLASMALLGSYTYFGVTDQTISLDDWLLIGTCGTTGGVAGAWFSALALRCTRQIRAWNRYQPMPRTLLIAAGCGLGVALIGILSGGDTFGTGYEQARLAVEGSPPSIAYPFLKFAASFLSMISGIPGGIFAPSLSIGAGIGATIGQFLSAPTGAAAILGMAAYFAGVVQAPMTAFVIILEMTGNHDNVIPVMGAAMIGYGTARLVTRETLYHALARLFVAEAIKRRRATGAVS
ncbi:MAG: chloride channel protein [Rhizobiaceae bacterium]|nr:chloride channel protein [Rhizobiaceae bacterium]